MSKHTWFRGVFLAVFTAVFGLTGCAGAPVSHGYLSATSADLEAVERGEYSPVAMAQLVAFVNPLIGVTKIPKEAMMLIQRAAIDCQWQIDPQLAGAWQSAITGGVSYGIAGGGAGPAARLGFGAAAKILDYTIYGIGAYVLPGAVNGLVTGSYGMASAKGRCAQKNWDEYKATTGKYRGIHIDVAYAGKAWGGSMPPALLDETKSSQASAPAPVEYEEEYSNPPPAAGKRGMMKR